METALGLAAVALLVAANAFFVAVEFALVAVDRARVRRSAEEGGRAARICEGLLRRLTHHLSGAQLGITATSLALGFIAEPTIARLIEPVLDGQLGTGGARGASILAALVLATVAQMLFGELVPKAVAIAKPLSTALVLAPPMRVYSGVFGPAIAVLDGAANRAVRRMGVEPTEELVTVRSLAELEILFQASAEEGILDSKASKLLRRSIRFGEKTAADVLVPRTALEAIQCEGSAADLVAAARRTGHSRFPVYGADLDDVRGVVHVNQVHRIPPDQRESTAVSELASEAVFVPETRDLDDLLVDIQRSRSHLVVAVDEYGGTAGIVTLEDLLEEIVGEIADEYDSPTTLTVVQQPGEWLLAGTLHPDEVTDACGFEIPEGAYETLAGFVLDRLGRIPEAPGEAFQYEGWTFVVEELERLRVATVLVQRPRATEEPG